MKKQFWPQPAWKKTLIGAVLLAGALLIALLIYTFQLLQPVDPAATSLERFIVPKGAAVQTIANQLHQQGFIKNPWVFRLIVKSKGLENKLQAGSFELSKNMAAQQIAALLTEGTQDVWVTILEGWRKEEIAESLANQGLDQFDADEFLSLAVASEGRLFPDTYLVPREITAAGMYQLLTSTFNRKVEQGLAEEIAASKYDLDKAIIMASLVEREANDYEQMRHVAGILWNRINIGMALQVDATLQYAKGYDRAEQTWWPFPTAADKSRQSPFNTYLNPGLPPRPIANPGLNAIKAALDPLEVDDLFYLHASDGSMYYAETLEGHNANVSRYLR